MTRRVAFRKAIVAGATGALAWDAAARLLLLLNVPVFDIVYFLGTMVVKDSPVLWPVGLLLHIGFGSIWAIFYAYFFWSEFAWHPAVQGFVFSIGVAVLAILIALPQMMLMHPMMATYSLESNLLWSPLKWSELNAVLLGHLIYGVTVGSIYTHPVGYPAGRRVAI
jgi:hypothetical protein